MHILIRIKDLIVEKKKIPFLIGTALIFIVVGVIGNKLIASMTLEKVKSAICIDSPSHPDFKSWLGNAKEMEKTFQIKMYYWNVTNKDDFLYNGAMPHVEQAGPYIYYFGIEKMSYVFDNVKKTVKFKTRMMTEFDPDATKLECPTCSQNDMLTIINFPYLNTMHLYGGDRNFALTNLPAAIQHLLADANTRTGGESTTYEKLGKLNDPIFPSNYALFPNNWIPGFSSWLSQMTTNPSSSLYNKINRFNFTVSEMKALYMFISDAKLLGVGQPLSDECKANETAQSCLQNGFTYLMNLKDKIKNGTLTSNSVLDNQIESQLNIILCPNTTYQCLSVSDDLLSAVNLYITEHLSKFSIHLLIDYPNYGLFTTRPEKELSVGYRMTLGLSVIDIPGYVANDTDETKAKEKAQFEEYWLCENTQGRKPFSLAALSNSDSVPISFFPTADSDFLKIDGYFTSRYIGHINVISMCRGLKEEIPTSRRIFDKAYQTSYIINQKEKTDLEGVDAYNYDVDFDTLYGVNNKSVFVKGLFDATNIRGGVPFIFSLPYFNGADDSYSKRFRMIPDVSKHSSLFLIEPNTGASITQKIRTQLNTVILDKYISAQRARAYNITYKQQDGVLNKPFPMLWIDFNVVPSAAHITKLKALGGGIKFGCGILVIGPLIAVILILVVIYIIYKAFKRVDIVDVKHNGSSELY